MAVIYREHRGAERRPPHMRFVEQYNAQWIVEKISATAT